MSPEHRFHAGIRSHNAHSLKGAHDVVDLGVEGVAGRDLFVVLEDEAGTEREDEGGVVVCVVGTVEV